MRRSKSYGTAKPSTPSKTSPNQQSLNISRDQTELETSRFNCILIRNDSIRHRLEEIQRILDELAKLKVIYEKTVLPNEEREIANRVDRTYHVLRNDLTQVKNEVEDLKMELEGDHDNFDGKEKELLRTNIEIFTVILKERLSQTHKFFNDFQETSKAKLCRQVKIIDAESNYSDEKISQMVDENPDIVANMVQRKVLGVASMELQGAAQDIFEKCESIKKLQRTVKELLYMMKTQIAEIVSIQGEKVDTIADHISNAKDHVIRVDKNLTQAKKHHASNRCVG